MDFRRDLDRVGQVGDAFGDLDPKRKEFGLGLGRDMGDNFRRVPVNDFATLDPLQKFEENIIPPLHKYSYE